MGGDSGSKRLLSIEPLRIHRHELGSSWSTTSFPESSLPRLSELVEASERWFALTSFSEDGDGYRRTTNEWRRRLSRQRVEAARRASEDVVRHFSKYLLLSELQSRLCAATLYPMVFDRRDTVLEGRPRVAPVV